MFGVLVNCESYAPPLLKWAARMSHPIFHFPFSIFHFPFSIFHFPFSFFYFLLFSYFFNLRLGEVNCKRFSSFVAGVGIFSLRLLRLAVLSLTPLFSGMFS